MWDKQKLTAHLQGEEECALGRSILDSAEMAWNRNTYQVTDFCDPHQVRIAQSILLAIPAISFLVQGGYPKAERSRLLLYPQLFLTETIPSCLSVLEVTGNFQFQQVSHRDYLGALLGCGIKREKVGDLLVTETGCQVIIASEIGQYVLSQWSAVGKVPISLREIDPLQLNVEPERVKEIKSTVAALRLDAIAASGFGISRTKMVREIKAQRVKVNWKPVDSPSFMVAQDDVIAIRGRGRVVVAEVRGETKKGRIGVSLQRLF